MNQAIVLKRNIATVQEAADLRETNGELGGGTIVSGTSESMHTTTKDVTITTTVNE